MVVGLRALALLIRMALPHPPRVLESVGQLTVDERDRVGRYLASPILPPSTEDNATTVRRDVRWLTLQATAGILVGRSGDR